MPVDFATGNGRMCTNIISFQVNSWLTWLEEAESEEEEDEDEEDQEFKKKRKKKITMKIII